MKLNYRILKELLKTDTNIAFDCHGQVNQKAQGARF